jgi:thiol-disulfide isomerase/thioredoxin
MVICIIALIVFAFLSLFSAKYRTYTKEAWHCVSRMARLKPCDTSFDEKMKASITAKLMERSPRLAKVVHKNFRVISAIFVIVFFLSLGYTAYSLYNLAVYGSCDLVTGQCIFNPAQPNLSSCPFESLQPSQGQPTIAGFYKIPNVSITGKPIVYFFGATWCPHCAWERPIFLQATAQFGNAIDVRKIEIDQGIGAQDQAVFNHFSPEGKIPLIIIGGRYFRIGSGEPIGQAAEFSALTALLCEITNNSAQICSQKDIQSLIDHIFEN